MSEDYLEPRQERREKKQLAEREKMAKHGRGLAQMYRDSILKRLGWGKSKPGGSPSS
jgi:hypothetical protein